MSPRSIVSLCLLALGLAGCGASPNEYFYTLSSTRASTGGSGIDMMKGRSIVVGPITLPEIADRPQIVTRVGANQVALAEQHRWAATLKSEIPRVIAENLSELLGRPVSSYEESSSARADIHILIDVQRFEAVLGETVTVDSLWTVRRASGEPTTGRSAVRESIRGDGYDGLVASYSRALVTVSRDIGQALRAMQY